MRNVEITTPHPDRNFGSQLVIDGRDMTADVTRATVEYNGPDRPRVTLTLRQVLDQRLCCRDAAVILGDSTREFLEDAGWTPPSVGDGGAA